MVFCSQCGAASARVDVKFCTSCGVAYDVAFSTRPVASSPPPPSSPPVPNRPAQPQVHGNTWGSPNGPGGGRIKKKAPTSPRSLAGGSPAPSVPSRPANYNGGGGGTQIKVKKANRPIPSPPQHGGGGWGGESSTPPAPPPAPRPSVIKARTPPASPAPVSHSAELRPRLQTTNDLSNIYKSIPTFSESATSPPAPGGVRQWKVKKDEYEESNPEFAYTRHKQNTVNPYSQAPEVLMAAQRDAGTEDGESAIGVKKVGSMIGSAIVSGGKGVMSGGKGVIGKVTDIVPVPTKETLSPEEKEQRKKQMEEEEKAKAEAERKKKKEMDQKEEEYMKRIRRHRDGIYTVYGEVEIHDLIESSSHGIFNCRMVGSKDVDIKKEQYTVYEIKVRWADVGWTIFRRYQQFHEFVVHLRKYSRVLLSVSLPPKKYIGSLDEEARKEGLVRWLQGVVVEQGQFLDDKKNEKAEQILIKFFAPIQMGDIKAPRLKLPFTITV